MGQMLHDSRQPLVETGLAKHGFPPYGCGASHTPHYAVRREGKHLLFKKPPLVRGGWGGIRMKLSIDNCCKFNGFMLLSQTRAEYLCCCASLSRRLGHQMFCGGTGTGEKAAECQLGLKNRLH